MYPRPPYERLAKNVVRTQLDLRVPPSLLEVTHELCRAHGSAATQELDGPTVRGCFLDVPRAAAARDAVLALDASVTWSLENALWYDEEAYFRGFVPIETRRFWVGPAWRESPKGKRRVVIAATTSVFGANGNPTTGALLLAMEATRLHGSVLDVGCGAGPTSVIASWLGAKSVLGIDIDPAAVELSKQLARRHRVKARFQHVPVQELDGRFDVVLANMPMEPLKAAAASILRLAKTTVIIAGYDVLRRDEALGAFVPWTAVALHRFGDYEAATLSAPRTR